MRIFEGPLKGGLSKSPECFHVACFRFYGFSFWGLCAIMRLVFIVCLLSFCGMIPRYRYAHVQKFCLYVCTLITERGIAVEVLCWGVFRNGQLVFASTFECTAQSIARSIRNVRGDFCQVKRTTLPETNEWIAPEINLRNLAKQVNGEK